jgi:predicted GNAT family N-acyltransferase
MPVDKAFSIVEAQLPDELPVIHTIRQQVFVEEQHIPGHLEWDGQDPSCCHVVALDPHHQAIGTGRISPDGRIGRMAVLKPWRSKGIGSAILDALLELARTKGHHSVYLHSRLEAVYAFMPMDTARVLPQQDFMSTGMPVSQARYPRLRLPGDAA